VAIYKRGKFYHYEFEFAGERVRCSTKQGSKEVAKTMMAQHRTRLAMGEVGLEKLTPAPIFKDFAWGRYWETMQSEHAAKPKTLKYHRTSLRLLSRFTPMQNVRINKIDNDMIDEFVAWARRQKAKNRDTLLGVASINRALEVLRHMLKLADRWNLVRKCPAISRLEGEIARDRIVSHAQEFQYLQAAAENAELHLVAVSMFDAGWRPEEVFRFSWPHVHLDPVGDARYGHVFNPFGKTKHARRAVPMTQRMNALMRWRWEQQGKPREGWVFSRDTKSGHVESLLEEHDAALAKAGIKSPFVLYTVRHTFLTRLGEAGADAYTIQKIGGHSDIRISARYVHPTDERAQVAFDRLEVYNAEQMKKAEAERKKEQVQ